VSGGAPAIRRCGSGRTQRGSHIRPVPQDVPNIRPGLVPRLLLVRSGQHVVDQHRPAESTAASTMARLSTFPCTSPVRVTPLCSISAKTRERTADAGVPVVRPVDGRAHRVMVAVR
jgi:hypothetical protein